MRRKRIAMLPSRQLIPNMVNSLQKLHMRVLKDRQKETNMKLKVISFSQFFHPLNEITQLSFRFSGCTPEKIWLLSRHGAIHPTKSASDVLNDLEDVRKISFI